MAETSFSAVYNRFLGKITDDLYLELTPEDTLRDLQNLLINAIPGFEFPRKNLYNYVVDVVEVPEEALTPENFVLGRSLSENGTEEAPTFLVDSSHFNMELSPEEINILALLMKQGWVQRQVTSIENTRMKYSGSDFKMTSQANHLSKLMSLLEDCRKDSFHMQRLYKRRRSGADGAYVSNWSSLMEVSALDD